MLCCSVCLERANEWVKCDVMYIYMYVCTCVLALAVSWSLCVLSISWSSELLLSFSAHTKEHIQAVHDYTYNTPIIYNIICCMFDKLLYIYIYSI